MPTTATTHTSTLERADGIVCALLTPYRPDGSIATDVLQAHTQSLIEQGIDGLYVCGSTGDGVMLDADSRVHCVQAVAEATEGEVPIIAHVGTNSTDMTLDLAERSVEAGADAVSSILPSIPLTAAETRSYFLDIVRASPAPFIAYNFPARSGVGLPQDLLAELAEEPNLYGLKNTSGDIFEMSAFTRLREGSLRVWNGHDEVLYAGLSVGACGAIGSTFNAFPLLYKDLLTAFRNGDHPEALRLQHQVEDLVRILVAFGVMPSLRAILASRGVEMGPSRRPQRDLDASSRSQLLSAIANLNLTA
ncbi:dihydrodipicolinate synthase family protein [Brachybacterium sp. GU-2]|uniref:dihydrodipicolinate synthase family protein n=1 Tax=Brachybacterium sp. GU-2 TaxID=3069708 RepID=UPI00280A8C25|nr:dihydrodipicolinate synthase family protein [Brachybacterium sp. GU-2]WME24448.1 dihydrodipicolinate synthase family protein [Brachybacterium sp. GU-2]